MIGVVVPQELDSPKPNCSAINLGELALNMYGLEMDYVLVKWSMCNMDYGDQSSVTLQWQVTKIKCLKYPKLN